MAMDFKSMTLEDIMAWCKANNQVDWLKSAATKKVPYKVYPKIEKDGKKVVDKTAEPKVEMRLISYVQLKMDFIRLFMPELLPKKDKKLTMYEKIANL